MKQLLYIAFALLAPLASVAQTEHYEQLFEEANELYAGGTFDSAIVLYESILAADYQSVPLYYNLANAYFKTNLLPDAILNYERAKRLAPTDPDIAFNLALANEHITDHIEPLPELVITKAWNAFLYGLSADGWATLCLLLIALSAAMLGLFLMSSRPALKKLGFVLMLVLLAAGGLSWVCASRVQRTLTAENQAIVFTPSVTVMSSPDKDGTKLFVIHEGTKVEVLEQRSEWLRISLPNGNEGWMLAEAVEII